MLDFWSTDLVIFISISQIMNSVRSATFHSRHLLIVESRKCSVECSQYVDPLRFLTCARLIVHLFELNKNIEKVDPIRKAVGRIRKERDG